MRPGFLGGVLGAEFAGKGSIVKEWTVSSAFKITRTGIFGKRN